MINPYETKEYLMIEAELAVHQLKLALKNNNNLDELEKAIYKIQHIKMDLLHTPAVCGVEGMRGITNGLDELKLMTIKQISNEPDSLLP
mgnify:CR=1 FL=1